MNIHPVVTQLAGVISVQLQASFLGVNASPPDTAQDAIDQAYILAYGDPTVNLGGQYTDVSGSPPTTLTFRFGTPQKVVGITTEMGSTTARFYSVVPDGQKQQPLDCVTSDPERAAMAWASQLQTACQIVMDALREKESPLLTLPDRDI